MRVNPYAAALLMLSFTVVGHASGNQKELKPWYGTLTLPSVPVSGCEVTMMRPFSSSWYFVNSTAEALQTTFEQGRSELESRAKNAGFYALIGFQADWLGGAGGLEYVQSYEPKQSVLTTGVLALSATGVEVVCK